MGVTQNSFSVFLVTKKFCDVIITSMMMSSQIWQHSYLVMNYYLPKFGDCSSYNLNVTVGRTHFLALRPKVFGLNSVKGRGKLL